MNGFRLRLRHAAGPRIEASALAPDRLEGLDVDALAGLELPCGRAAVPLKDLFEIESREDEESCLELHESTARVSGLGAGMGHGELRVHGDVGGWLGRGMQGGRAHVLGDCGAYAASAMSGGCIEIDGDAGDFLGGAAPGERLGMRGGTVLVHGNAGKRLAERMRGGLVLVEGHAGASCAVRMVAGTVAVRGGVGAGPGRGMRRGTLLLGQAPAALGPGFQGGETVELVFLTLLLRHLASLTDRGWGRDGASARRWVGDAANAGLGEILICPSSPGP